MFSVLKGKLLYFLEKRLGYQGCTILKSAEGKKLISPCLKNAKPIAIGKLRALETYAIRNFLVQGGGKIVWSPRFGEHLYGTAGVFPKKDEIFNAFCGKYLNSLKYFRFIGSMVQPW
jgi:hypothetical protein